MRKFKKAIATVMTSAMVFGMVGFMPAVEAKAAGLGELTYSITAATSGDVTFDLSGTNPEYFIGGKADKEPTTWSAAAASPLKINVSGVSTKKDFVIWGRSASVNSGVTTYTTKSAVITGNATKLKIKYVPNAAATKKFDFGDYKAADIATKIFYRVGDGEWKAVGDTSALETAAAALLYTGGTIYFREGGTAGTASAVGKFPSAEAKVKIPKMAKAPKITVDYAKQTIKTPKGLQLDADVAKIATPTPVADAKTYTMAAGTDQLPTTLGTLAAGVKFYARVGATDKKPASEIVLVTAPAQPTFVEADKALITIVETKTDKTGTTKVEIKNGTSKDIEFFLGAAKDTAAPTDGKWIKLAAGKTYSVAKEKAGAFVRYRYPAAKATKTDAAAFASTMPQSADTQVIPTWTAPVTTP